MELNKYIDHTLLNADATINDIEQLCAEAKAYDFASVCVHPFWVKFAAQNLEGESVKVCTVIGFPLGASTPEIKAAETANAVENGADEIDMVINIGALKSKKYQTVYRDIHGVVEKAKGRVVKVILEMSLLTTQEKIKACELAVEAGAHFVKTSTGFSTGGATLEDVRLMVEAVQGKAEIKASGGVRTLDDVQKYIDAGATRIGTSKGIGIMEGKVTEDGY